MDTRVPAVLNEFKSFTQQARIEKLADTRPQVPRLQLNGTSCCREVAPQTARFESGVS